MARALQELDERAEQRERDANSARQRAATRTWWGTPASTSTEAWVSNWGATVTPNPLPAPQHTPAAPRTAPARSNSLISVIPQMSQGGDTTRFCVLAEDLMVGDGALDHLLTQDEGDNLANELLEERAKGEVDGEGPTPMEH